MKTSLSLAFFLTAGLCFSADAASVSKTYSYFAIGGSTLEQIQDELDLRGPEVKTTGRRHPGATQMEFASRVGYLEGPRGCKVSSASVTVKAKIILPRWRRPRSAEADVRLIWDTLASDIKRHEESHVSIAKNHARDLEQELRRIGTQRDCAAARARVGEVTRKVLARHDRAQTDFDRAEGANFEQRILRLLRYRMQRMANGRLRD